MKTTARVSLEVEIDRPPQAVWGFVSDAERTPEWIEEFVESKVTSPGEVGVGSVGTYTIMPGPRTGTIEVLEWDPPRRLVLAGPPLKSMGGAAAPHAAFDIDDLGDGRSRLRCTFSPELHGVAVLLKPYLRRWMKRQRTIDLQKLKTIVEADGE